MRSPRPMRSIRERISVFAKHSIRQKVLSHISLANSTQPCRLYPYSFTAAVTTSKLNAVDELGIGILTTPPRPNTKTLSSDTLGKHIEDQSAPRELHKCRLCGCTCSDVETSRLVRSAWPHLDSVTAPDVITDVPSGQGTLTILVNFKNT